VIGDQPGNTPVNGRNSTLSPELTGRDSSTRISGSPEMLFSNFFLFPGHHVTHAGPSHSRWRGLLIWTTEYQAGDRIHSWKRERLLARRF
jgi:hypothetical protein